MKKSGYFFGMLLCLSCLPDLRAQVVPVEETLFRQSVKSCDEFMYRFNQEETFPGLEADDSLLHQKNLLLLFDHELVSKDKDKFYAAFQDFYQAVSKDSVKLSYESPEWYAEQLTDFIYQKKQVQLGVVFHTERDMDSLWHWAVVGVNGLEKIGVPHTLRRMGISPEQHESEFMELESCFKFYKNDFSQFRSLHIPLDRLSYFFALVESEALKFDRRSSLKYYFFEVPGYVFSVSFFSRKSGNSGWLISNFVKVDEAEKQKYKNKILGK